MRATTTRSYRRAFTHERALEIMASETGETVDPELFPLFEREIAPRIAPLGAEVEIFASA